jgi:multidrug efflux pump
MSRIFIDRPIFAWVIAILIMLVGAGAITQLPIAQYPDIAPPQVSINATYPGASADTLQNSVTQILEQQLTGIDGLLYFNSSSSSNGQVSITATFAKGTNPDVAQMQVQNSIQASISRLPQQVQQQGVRVTKSNPDILLIVGVYDETNRATNVDIGDWLVNNMQYQVGRLAGVGNMSMFGSQYAMRVWLDPAKLQTFNLMPSDVISAINAQNVQVAAGEVGGQPQPTSQMLDATVTAQSKLQTPKQFRNIIVKSDPTGARVLLSDVARVELGADNYNIFSRVDGHPGAGMAIYTAPGADALKTAALVKQTVQQIAKNFPPGYRFTYAYDTTSFIKLSVTEVVKTLIEAMILVVLVMFAFLQSWRTTIIPAVAIPVVLLGTFGVLDLIGARHRPPR